MTALLAIAAVVLRLHADALRLAVVGDIGAGTAEVAAGIARVHGATPLDAILTTGDNVYPCGVQSASDPKWEVVRPLAALGIPIFPVLGNHDHCGKADAEIGTAIFPTWRFPAREYVIHSAVADIAMLDTSPYAAGRAPPPDLTRQFAGSTAPWRLAVGHHPLISSGYHGHLPRGEHQRMLHLIPAMRAAKVDLYVCGHDHHLELIDGRPRMLISGAGSDPVPPLLRHAKTLWAGDGPPYRGFAVVEITSEKIAVRFYDAGGTPRSRAFTFTR